MYGRLSRPLSGTLSSSLAGTTAGDPLEEASAALATVPGAVFVVDERSVTDSGGAVTGWTDYTSAGRDLVVTEGAPTTAGAGVVFGGADSVGYTAASIFTYLNNPFLCAAKWTAGSTFGMGMQPTAAPRMHLNTNDYDYAAFTTAISGLTSGDIIYRADGTNVTVERNGAVFDFTPSAYSGLSGGFFYVGRGGPLRMVGTVARVAVFATNTWGGDYGLYHQQVRDWLAIA